ncbi:MAG: hypothetical protein WC728_10145 [Elusimicrobiota bacterium]
MAGALIGWLLVLLSLIGGFLIGRYRRLTARPAPPVRSAPPAPRSHPVSKSTRTVRVPVSTVTPPVNLPSDTDRRRPDSVPKRLE